MNTIKSFFKELKRVRWPSANESISTFWKAVIFVSITAVTFFLLTLGFTSMWSWLGVGING